MIYRLVIFRDLGYYLVNSLDNTKITVVMFTLRNIVLCSHASVSLVYSRMFWKVFFHQESERYELEEEENSLSLVIRRLEDQDRGLYTCQVSIIFLTEIRLILTFKIRNPADKSQCLQILEQCSSCYTPISGF